MSDSEHAHALSLTLARKANDLSWTPAFRSDTHLYRAGPYPTAIL